MDATSPVFSAYRSSMDFALFLALRVWIKFEDWDLWKKAVHSCAAFFAFQLRNTSLLVFVVDKVHHVVCVPDPRSCQKKKKGRKKKKRACGLWSIPRKTLPQRSVITPRSPRCSVSSSRPKVQCNSPFLSLFLSCIGPWFLVMLIIRKKKASKRHTTEENRKKKKLYSRHVSRRNNESTQTHKQAP